MERKDAIAAFGRYYQINTANQMIEERLGRIRANAAGTNFDQLEDAQEAMTRAIRKDAQDKIKRIRAEMGTVRYKVESFLARHHLHVEGHIIRDIDKKLKDDLQKAQAVLTNPNPISPAIRMLPEKIRLPAPLEIGQPVHKVRAGSYHDGYEIETLRINSRTIERCMTFMSTKYDYHYAYQADGPHTKSLRFYYDHPDLSHDAIDTGYGEQRVFLRSEPAEEMTLGVIGRLTGEFNAALKDINRRRADRGEPALPLLDAPPRTAANNNDPAVMPSEVRSGRAPRSAAIRSGPPSL